MFEFEVCATHRSIGSHQVNKMLVPGVPDSCSIPEAHNTHDVTCKLTVTCSNLFVPIHIVIYIYMYVVAHAQGSSGQRRAEPSGDCQLARGRGSASAACGPERPQQNAVHKAIPRAAPHLFMKYKMVMAMCVCVCVPLCFGAFAV